MGLKGYVPDHIRKQRSRKSEQFIPPEPPRVDKNGVAIYPETPEAGSSSYNPEDAINQSGHTVHHTNPDP